jgi:hypothetical protein
VEAAALRALCGLEYLKKETHQSLSNSMYLFSNSLIVGQRNARGIRSKAKQTLTPPKKGCTDDFPKSSF